MASWHAPDRELVALVAVVHLQCGQVKLKGHIGDGAAAEGGRGGGGQVTVSQQQNDNVQLPAPPGAHPRRHALNVACVKDFDFPVNEGLRLQGLEGRCEWRKAGREAESRSKSHTGASEARLRTDDGLQFSGDAAMPHGAARGRSDPHLAAQDLCRQEQLWERGRRGG